MDGYATIVTIIAYWGVVNDTYLRLIKIWDHVAKCLKLGDRKTFVLSGFWNNILSFKHSKFIFPLFYRMVVGKKLH